MNCEECKEKRIQQIPYIAYEAECARHERMWKRMLAVIILCVLLVVGSNIAWLCVWNQYDYVDETYDYSQDGRGINIIGNDNEAGQYGAETDYTSQNEN